MSLKFKKEVISIEIIGKKRFLIGTVVGITAAVCLSFFLDYSRESLRIFSFMSKDLLILPKKEIDFFDYFFAAFSTIFGFGFSLWIWLSNPRQIRAKERHYKRFAQTNILLTIWVFLMFIARWGTIIPIILYSQRGYDNQLDLYKDAWLIFVLIPVVMFLNIWYSVRLVYKSGKWILLSLIVVLLITTLLANVKTVNRNIFKEAFENLNADKYKYIDDEFNKALSYNIIFNKETKQALKQNFTERSLNQIAEIQNSFNRKKKVSLDTLILEKIIIHNRKQRYLSLFNRDKADKNWSYAYPEQIFEQIKMYNKDCIQVQYLFEILNEMILPFTVKDADWNTLKQYSKYQINLLEQKRFLKYYTRTILSRLMQVAERLRQENKYEKYSYLIPETDINTYCNNHRQKKLILNLDSIEEIYNRK